MSLSASIIALTLGGAAPACGLPPAAARGRDHIFRASRPVRERRSEERQGRAEGRPARNRLRPHGEGLFPRRRPCGADEAARLYRGAGDDRDLVRARSSRTSPCRGRRATRARAITAIGSPISRRSTRISAPMPNSRPSSMPRHARDEGLYGHHREPHGGCHSLRRRRSGSLPLSRDRRLSPFRGAAGSAARRSIRGFAGDHVADTDNWKKLTDPGFAYVPVIPGGRGDGEGPGPGSTTRLLPQSRQQQLGSASRRSMATSPGSTISTTENPRVVDGFIDIFGGWIDEFGIDGFRIDTAKHVNPEFWQAFVPAMQARAKARGIPLPHLRRSLYRRGRSGRARPVHPCGGIARGARLRLRARRDRCGERREGHRSVRHAVRRRPALQGRRGDGACSCRPSSATTTWAASRCS